MSSSSTNQVRETSPNSENKICNFIHDMLKEILTDDEGYMLVVELIDNRFSF
jgi:hypothetical protein